MKTLTLLFLAALLPAAALLGADGTRRESWRRIVLAVILAASTCGAIALLT